MGQERSCGREIDSFTGAGLEADEIKIVTPIPGTRNLDSGAHGIEDVITNDKLWISFNMEPGGCCRQGSP